MKISIKNLQVLQKTIFYSILLFLPTQLGKHFWPSWSYVTGLRIDYLSPTLYITDFLVIVLFIFWFFSTFLNRESKFSIFNFQFSINVLIFKNLSFISNFKFQILFFLFLLIGIFLSKNPQAGLYGLLKLLEFAFFAFYTARTVRSLQDVKTIAIVFSIGIFFESVLAITQYIKQASIGGVLYFFGERTFTSQTPGIANASLNGQLILRPYGTFPHPNVLAGYLVIAMTIIIFNFQFLIFNQISILKKIIFFFSILIGTIALLLTMSRIAIILWLVILPIWFFKIFTIKISFQISNFKFQIMFFFILLVVVSILLSPLQSRFLHTALTDESFSRRKELMYASFQMIKTHPIFGVGLYNFLPNLPSVQKSTTESFFTLLQPVHNIFLLVVVETGMVGFLFFLWVLAKTYKQVTSNKPMIHYSLFIILIIGIFDHYFLTLQQGQLLFALTLGLCWSKLQVPKKKE